MSGCPHECQRSSISSLEQTKSWIPLSIISFPGMAGWIRVQIHRVKFSSRIARERSAIFRDTRAHGTLLEPGFKAHGGACHNDNGQPRIVAHVSAASPAPIEYPQSATGATFTQQPPGSKHESRRSLRRSLRQKRKPPLSNSPRWPDGVESGKRH